MNNILKLIAGKENMKDSSVSRTEKVFVAISGGVDSAVSAALLKEQGYAVTGVFMKNWSGDNFGIQAECPWEEDQKMAESVCVALDIPFRTFNFEKQYREKVMEYFFSEYKAGRTPNPDVMCNKEIKFGLFLEKALAEGADLIATGHYARVQKTSQGRELLKGLDPSKDQSYFLYNLTQDQLSKTLFPIGVLLKSEVRRLAYKFELPNAARPDSQGICFIGEIDIQEFLRKNIAVRPGGIKDIDTGALVGEHDGVWFYTIGQREGLGVGGQAEPYFVVGKNLEENILYVGHGNHHPALFKRTLKLENLHLINPGREIPAKVEAATRYRQKPQLGTLDVAALTFTFNQPQRAITEGQSLVLYDGEICLGGGIIGQTRG